MFYTRKFDFLVELVILSFLDLLIDLMSKDHKIIQIENKLHMRRNEG